MSQKKDNYSPEEKLAIANKRIEAISERIHEAIYLNETCEIISFSGVLKSQIPRSRAATAYNHLSHQLIQQLALKLCTLWDEKGSDYMSFPYISKLIEKDVLDFILIQRENKIRNSKHEYGFSEGFTQERKESFIKQDIERRINEKKIEVTNYFTEAKKLINKTLQNQLLISIKELRTKHLAHYLDKSQPEEEITERPTIKFGAPKELLDISIKCCDLLNLGIKSHDYNFTSYQDLARKNTGELWHNCKFAIPKN